MEATKKKHLSGYQKRKRRAAMEEALKKQAGAMYNYIKPAKTAIDNSQHKDNAPGPSTTKHIKLEEDQEGVPTIHSIQTEECLPSTSGAQQDLYAISRTGDNDGQWKIGAAKKTNLPSSSSRSNLLDHDLEDPAKWPHITDRLRLILTELGPVQKINLDYPKDSSRRRFSNTYYNRKMENGDLLPRPWLVYSESKDCVFCFCCKIFSLAGSRDASSLVTTGYNQWRKLSAALHTHETSTGHLKRLTMWNNLRNNLKNKTTLDFRIQPSYELVHNADVITRLIEIVKYLGSQCLAQWGSYDHHFQNNHGNYLDLVELFGKFDTIIAAHIERTIGSDATSRFFSEDIPIAIIELVGKTIRDKIVSSINKAKYFSVILDSTPDISRTERISVVARFVSCAESLVLIEERFLGFLEFDDARGEDLCDTILSQLSTWNLNINNIRGQSYDNNTGTRGKKIGLQKRILSKYPRAFHVPCSAHSLNTVVGDAASANCEMIRFFGTVREIFTFFSASDKSWGCLKKHIASLTLEPVSETRWDCCVEALRVLRYQTGETYDALYEMYCDEDFDIESRYRAQVICASLKDFQFLCSLILWCDLLSHIHPVSETLQNTDEDISIALAVLDNLIEFVSHYRIEMCYESLIEESRQLCQDLDGEPQFQAAICRRRASSQLEHELKVENPQTSEDLFRENFFDVILDVVTFALKERFDQLQQHVNRFQFLYDINNVSGQDKENLRRQCVNLENHLSDDDNRDISGIVLCDELCAFRDLFSAESEPFKDPYETIKFIHTNRLSFPNLETALRIFLTLPVREADGERLKLIQNYLQSSISQKKIANLAMVAIEGDLCSELQTEHLVSKFRSQIPKNGLFS